MTRHEAQTSAIRINALTRAAAILDNDYPDDARVRDTVTSLILTAEEMANALANGLDSVVFERGAAK